MLMRMAEKEQISVALFVMDRQTTEAGSITNIEEPLTFAETLQAAVDSLPTSDRRDFSRIM